jgi:alpha-galactosidase
MASVRGAQQIASYGAAPAQVSVDCSRLDYPTTLKAKVRKLWAGKDLGVHRGCYEATAPSAGAVMPKVQP